MPERVDQIETGSAQGRIPAEEHADQSGKQHGQNDRCRLDKQRPAGGIGDDISRRRRRISTPINPPMARKPGRFE